MTAAELTQFQRTLRQMLPDLGIGSVISALKKALPEQTLHYNTVFQLETRFNSLNKDRIRGIIAQDDLDIAYNRISADLLELIDGLKPTDFDLKTAESSVEDKAGSILYRIPHTMEVAEEHRCIVRLAFDVDDVIKNIELTKDTVVKDVRVSEVMEVELVDPNETACFAIRRLNSVEQFLEKNEYTEWIFFVKPLVTGELPLVLKVSVKEIIHDRERIKEIVLEEVITVIADPAPPVEQASFQNAGYTISYTNAPATGNNKRKSALLLVLGLVVASGLFATAVLMNWIPEPDWWLGKSDASERAFWQKMETTHTRSSFETYLRAYPEGIFATQAQRKIDSLMQLEKQVTPVPPVSENLIPATESAPQVSPIVPPAKPPASTKPKPVPAPPGNKPNPPRPTGAPRDTNPKPAIPTPEPPAGGKKRKSGFDMVQVPQGNFKTPAGACAQPNVSVQAFKIGKYEITQADWREIMGTSPSFHNNCGDCPVEKVSWDEIQRFLKIASQKKGRQYRLPSELEWEFAASGGSRSLGKKYAGGNDPNSVAWFNIIQEKTHEVGTKRANELGIFDMSGNVAEWCATPYPAYLNCMDKITDKKALRGGSWADKRGEVTIQSRRLEKTKNADRRSGFRIIEE